MAGVCEDFLMLCAILKHSPSDVLGRLHHPLKGLAIVDGAIPVPGHDTTGQDALEGALVVFGENPGMAC